MSKFIKKNKRSFYKRYLAIRFRSSVFNIRKSSLKDIKVACIVDDFAFQSLDPECHLKNLTSYGWKGEICDFGADLLYIESTWQGEEGSWAGKSHDSISLELFEIIAYFRKKGVPIVFWNKEDPYYFASFIQVAKLADYVFTTDADLISKYKVILKHDKVFHLHFAAQPKVHNPEELFERKDKYCFAGAYYRKFKERSLIFDKFADLFIDTKGLDIYDRNSNNSSIDTDTAFPDYYTPYVIGTLTGKDIVKAYKGYHYAINMNSMTQSSSMFARRVFELLASNTVIISNYAKGLKNYFGDCVINTNDTDAIKGYVLKYCKDDHMRAKYKLLGLRKVYSEHLYEDRFGYIIERVFGKNLKRQMPTVLVLAKVSNMKECEYIIDRFNIQSYENKRLLIFTDTQFNIASVTTMPAVHLADYIEEIDGEYLTVFNTDDYYNENYLTDILLMTRYDDFDIIGKGAYISRNGVIKYNKLDCAYKRQSQFCTRRAVFKKELVNGLRYRDILDSEYVLKGYNGFSTDYFSYCENGGDHCIEADDLYISDSGTSLWKNNKSKVLKSNVSHDA